MYAMYTHLLSTITIYFYFNISALESELLKEFEPAISQPKLQPLKNILSSMNFTPTSPLSSSDGHNLSGPAIGIIEVLPDLNFMKAKVLMFAVKGAVDESDSGDQEMLNKS